MRLAVVVCEVFLATVVPGMKTMTNSPVSGGSDDSVKKTVNSEFSIESLYSVLFSVLSSRSMADLIYKAGAASPQILGPNLDWRRTGLERFGNPILTKKSGSAAGDILC